MLKEHFNNFLFVESDDHIKMELQCTIYLPGSLQKFSPLWVWYRNHGRMMEVQ